MSFDLNIVPEPSDANVERLSLALVDLAAEVVYAGKVRHLIQGEWLRASRTWNFSTKHGRFDVLFEPTGIAGYATLRANAISVELDAEVTVLVASIDDLIAMKESANRAKDQSVLAYLRYIRDRQANPGP